MKKIILLGSVAFLSSSCATILKQTATKSQADDFVVSIKNNYDLRLTTVTIDSCEYLVGLVGFDSKSIVLTHKGNCKYCASRHSAGQ
jgi:hypothetical protein